MNSYDDPAADRAIDETVTTEADGAGQRDPPASIDVDPDRWRFIHESSVDRAGDEELATALIYAIAEAIGVDPLDHGALPPLYEAIDAQALQDALVSPAEPRHPPAWTVAFEYNGLFVVLRAEGWVGIYEAR